MDAASAKDEDEPEPEPQEINNTMMQNSNTILDISPLCYANTNLPMVELFSKTITCRADAHLALRTILSSYLNEPPEKICFERTSFGKPLHSKIFFSLSHSQDLAVIAVSQVGSVGVDVEFKRRVPGKLLMARRFFAPTEYAYLKSLPVELQEDAFFKLWTAKEALIKAKGLRFMGGLSNEVVWDQVTPIRNLEKGYIGHLAGQVPLDLLYL